MGLTTARPCAPPVVGVAGDRGPRRPSRERWNNPPAVQAGPNSGPNGLLGPVNGSLAGGAPTRECPGPTACSAREDGPEDHARGRRGTTVILPARDRPVDLIATS